MDPQQTVVEQVSRLGLYGHLRVNRGQHCRRNTQEQNHKQALIDDARQQPIQHQNIIAANPTEITLELIRASFPDRERLRVQFLLARVVGLHEHLVPENNDEFSVGQKASENPNRKKLAKFGG